MECVMGVKIPWRVYQSLISRAAALASFKLIIFAKIVGSIMVSYIATKIAFILC